MSHSGWAMATAWSGRIAHRGPKAVVIAVSIPANRPASSWMTSSTASARGTGGRSAGEALGAAAGRSGKGGKTFLGSPWGLTARGARSTTGASCPPVSSAARAGAAGEAAEFPVPPLASPPSGVAPALPAAPSRSRAESSFACVPPGIPSITISPGLTRGFPIRSGLRSIDIVDVETWYHRPILYVWFPYFFPTPLWDKKPLPLAGSGF